MRLASSRLKASAMRILIAGATGAIGRPLAHRLTANQHEVFALTRSLDTAPLKEIGAEPIIADALDAPAVKAAVGRIRPDAVINELTSLPRRYTPAEMKAAAERDHKVRVEGNMNMLAALRNAGVRRYLLQSSGFWYEPGTGLADESVPFISSASPGVEAGARTYLELEARASATSGIEFVARYVTDSSMAPAPGARARAIWAIRCGDSKFRLSARVRGSPASCISTMRPERPPPRWNARRERTTSSTETRRLSRLFLAEARRRGRSRSARERREPQALPTRKPGASSGSVRVRSSGFRSERA